MDEDSKELVMPTPLVADFDDEKRGGVADAAGIHVLSGTL